MLSVAGHLGRLAQVLGLHAADPSVTCERPDEARAECPGVPARAALTPRNRAQRPSPVDLASPLLPVDEQAGME